MKKLLAVLLTLVLIFGLVACANDAPAPAPAPAPPAADTQPAPQPEPGVEAFVLRVGFENSLAEPFGQGMLEWQRLVDEMGDGSIRLELFPDSQLGSKSELIDSMFLGEPVVTLADGAFYADYGVNDFGIVFGPFLFNSWEEAWTLTESEWYQEQKDALEDIGLRLIGSNWMYGERHLLTNDPVHTVEDLAGMRIRVPGNQIQAVGFDVLGASSVGMPLGDVYQALQTGVIDGAENPPAVLYGRMLHEVANYLTLTAHVHNFTTLVMSADVFHSLTTEQQELLTETLYLAGLYNNELQAASVGDFLARMEAAGVTIIEPTQEALEGFRAAARAFYDMEDTFGWSAGLYERVLAAMGR